MEPALRSGSAGTEAVPPPGAWRATRLVWPAVLLGLAVWGVLLAARGRGSDFAIYVRAASRFSSGEPIYRASDGAWVFKYAPPSAVMFIPFASLPIRIATALWNLLLVGSLALLKPLLAALFEPGPGEPRAPLSGAALAISSIAVGQSLFLELFYGQIDVPMLLLLVASASFAERGRPAMAGAAWALAVSFKPTAVLFGVYLITRRPRAILLGLAAGVALWIPALLRYGLSGAWELAASWGETVSRTTPAWILGSNAQGLPTLLLLGYPGVPLAAHVVAAQLAALGLASAMLWLMRRSRPHLLAGACFSVAFTSALAWRANFALALPMVALACTDRSRTRSLAFALAALAGLVQLTVVEGVLGATRHEAALLARPFGLAFGALFVWTVISALRSTRRRQEEPRESASAVPDAHRRATTPRGGV